MGYMSKIKCPKCEYILHDNKANLKLINHYCIREHKNCINKEKIINWLTNTSMLITKTNDIYRVPYEKFSSKLINDIENGEFD